MSDIATIPPGSPLSGLSPDVRTKAARQGTGAGPSPTAFTENIMARVSRTPAAPGEGGGPSGYSSGAISSRSATPAGSGIPSETYHRPPGSFFPGDGIYLPPHFPPGGGYPAGDESGLYAPADGPYLLSVLDSRLPNGIVPPGLSSIISDKSYIYTQSSPASVWTIAHGMNKFPAVAVVDSAGSEVYGDVLFVDINTVTVTFSAAFAGTAYLN